MPSASQAFFTARVIFFFFFRKIRTGKVSRSISGACKDDSWEKPTHGEKTCLVSPPPPCPPPPPPFHVGQHRHMWDFLKSAFAPHASARVQRSDVHTGALASGTGGASRTRRPQFFSHQPLCRGQKRTCDFLTQLTTREDPGQKHTDGWFFFVFCCCFKKKRTILRGDSSYRKKNITE